jgi:glycerol-3-phosphate dehydrogenase
MSKRLSVIGGGAWGVALAAAAASAGTEVLLHSRRESDLRPGVFDQRGSPPARPMTG